MRTQRIEEMMAFIKSNKTVAIEELCSEFNVSVNTVRRDLAEILKTKEFKKIYGGITCDAEGTLKSFQERLVKNREQKQRIGALAAGLVADRDIIFIDSGSTACHMIEHLGDKKDVTVLTHNIEAINQAIKYPNLHVIALPGDLNRKTCSFAGSDAAKYLANYNIGKSFLATTGLSVERGITNSILQEHEIKVTAIARSDENYILADASKFNNVSLLTYSNFEHIQAVISDRMPGREFQVFFAERGIGMIVS